MKHQVEISPLPAMPVGLALESFTSGVGAQPPRAMATTLARPPLVTAIRNVTVTAVQAVASALGIVPQAVGAATAASVTAARATATATAYAGAASVSGSANVTAVVASATTRAYVPVSNASVIAVRAPGTTAAPAAVTAHSVIGETVLTGGGPGAGTALAYPPSVSVAGSSGPAPILASFGAYDGQANNPVASIAIPAGIAVNDIMLIFLVTQNYPTITPPSGFVEAPNSPATVSGVFDLHVYWKRVTIADTGTYDFSLVSDGAAFPYWLGFASRVIGCVTSGSPFDASNSANKATSDTTVPAVSVTTTGLNRLLTWVAASFAGPTCSTPTGFTEVFEVTDPAQDGLALDTKIQAITGASGSVTANFDLAGPTAAWLAAMIPVPATFPLFGGAGTPIAGGTGTACNFPVPTGVANNDIVMVFFYSDPDSDVITPAAGFAAAPSSPAVVGGATARWNVFWKRASGADSGTYNFTLASAATYREGFAARYTGCITSGSPFDTGTGAPVTGSSFGDLNYPSTTLTTTGPNRLVVWAADNNVPTPNITNQPSGYVKDFEYNAQGLDMCLASNGQTAAGSTGTLTATVTTGTNSKGVWLGALLSP